MTIEDLLEMPALNGLKLLAGKTGIHRRISTVTVLDAPDATIWLKGHEFVITTAYAIKDNSNPITSLIQQLLEGGAAGLGIKTERYIKTVPQPALDLAEKESFPLIFIPDKYAFCDIINPVLSQIVNKQSALLVQSSKIHKNFLELAINNHSVPEILQALSQLLGCSTCFVDIHFHKCYYSNYESRMCQELVGLKFDDLIHKAFAQYRRYIVENKSERFGYLLVSSDVSSAGEEENNPAKTAIEYASIVLILWMQTQISNRQIEEKYRDVFLEDLLLNNVKTENEIINRAQLYGWDFRHGGLVVVIDINNIKKYYLKSLDEETNKRLEGFTHNIFEISIQSMNRFFSNAKYYKQSDTITFVLLMDEFHQIELYKKLEQTFDQIRSQITHQVSFTITMGVGEYVKKISDIYQSYTQARTAINLGYQLEKFDCVLFFNQLGIYRLLATSIHSKEAEDFYTRYIEPIVDYDAKNHSNLLKTLLSIVKNGWNLKEASQELFIHYNTAKYRFGKICDILNLDLHNHESQLSVEIALRIYLLDNHYFPA